MIKGVPREQNPDKRDSWGRWGLAEVGWRMGEGILFLKRKKERKKDMLL